MASQIKHPPSRNTEDGKTRRVGVELEFGGLSALDAAELVKRVLGGEVCQNSEHRFTLDVENLGQFVIELDTQYAHPNDSLQKKFGEESWLVAADKTVSSAVGALAGSVVPTEIVSPPIPYTKLDLFDELLDELRESGAKGTNETPWAAFGVHLNPEISDSSAEHLTAMLQAYLLASPILRETKDVDMLRQITPFIDPFPDSYCDHVLRTDYAPERETLIDDYLEHNPTRNRELDLLPLFKHLDERRVSAIVDDELVKARPTYHYRLPDMTLNDESWTVAQEWNRWVAIENLAADHSALNEMINRRSKGQSIHIDGLSPSDDGTA